MRAVAAMVDLETPNTSTASAAPPLFFEYVDRVKLIYFPD
jgi:hypothetical protein